MVSAVETGMQVVGPLQVQAGGLGQYEVPAESVWVSGEEAWSEALESGSQRLGDKVWIEAVPETDGRLSPGVPFSVSYYCYARIYVDDIEYWWSAPEFGTATCIDAPYYLDWDLVEYGIQRCLLCTLEVTPACAGSLQVPVMEAYVVERSRNPFQKGLEYYPVSRPLAVAVYPFPEDERPANWNGCLTDSVAIELIPLYTYSGQGGERYVRMTVSGPGAAAVDQPPDLTVTGPARILRGSGGEADNKRWWDLVVDPSDAGEVVLGPDSIAWFDRESGGFRQAVVSPCTLDVYCLPGDPVELEFDPGSDGESLFWLWLAAGSALIVTAVLLIRSRKRRSGVVKLTATTDSEELMTAFEAELSGLLRGRRGYLESEQLSELMGEREVSSMLSRRVVRFWKDMERLLSGREPSSEEFGRLRDTAVQLVDELEGELEAR